MISRHTGKIFGAILITALAGQLLITGCTNAGGKTAADPQKAIYAVAVALTAADTVALHYVTLPLCGPTHAKPMCSEASVSKQIKANAQAAHDAVVAAEIGKGTLDAAQAAVDALVKSTPQIGG